MGLRISRFLLDLRLFLYLLSPARLSRKLSNPKNIIMADHLSYEQSKKMVFRGLFLLAAITVIEVLISLFGKGYLGWDPSTTFQWTIPFVDFTFRPILGLVALGLIGFSVYKAKFIIFDFMHMKYEAKGMALTVLLPMSLLIWGMIAFFQEGNDWGNRRKIVQVRNKIEAQAPPTVSPIERAPINSTPKVLGQGQ